MLSLKMRKKPIFLILILFAAVFLGGGNARAIPLPFDPLSLGLNPGDEFRLAFVTNGTRTATSANIGDYNAFVAAEAERAGAITQGLGLTWTAIASTSAVDARDNTGTNRFVEHGVPIFLLDGSRIAHFNVDLWDGNLTRGIDLDQFGLLRSSLVWTGTSLDGTDQRPLGGTTNGEATAGRAGQSNSGWISSSILTDLATSRSLYALSSTIQVASPVPEPGSLLLFGCAVTGLGLWRFRKQTVADF